MLVPEFEKVGRKLEQQVTLRGQSNSTLKNYIQRIVLTLIYSAGLRGQEVINLEISDIDYQRMTIHIRQSKYKKDRIVPLAESMAVGLKKYLQAENTHIWLFKHYHIIFTVPHHLNAVCLHNQRMYYDLLFAAVWSTLHSFGYTHYRVESGAVAVLHIPPKRDRLWGQNLSLHPHIHCIVPAAGYSLDGRWKNIGNNWKFLYPVYQLSDAFKGKFLDRLKRTLGKQNEWSMFKGNVQQAYNKVGSELPRIRTPAWFLPKHPTAHA